MSVCPHCKGTMFQTERQAPLGSAFPVVIVQCSKCGAPVGVLEMNNAGALLQAQDQMIKQLGSRISGLEQSLVRVEAALRKR